MLTAAIFGTSMIAQIDYENFMHNYFDYVPLLPSSGTNDDSSVGFIAALESIGGAAIALPSTNSCEGLNSLLICVKSLIMEDCGIIGRMGSNGVLRQSVSNCV